MAGAVYKTGQRLWSSFSGFAAKFYSPQSCSLSMAAHTNCTFSGSKDFSQEVHWMRGGQFWLHGDRLQLVRFVHSSAMEVGNRKMHSSGKDEEPLDNFHVDGEDNNLNDACYEQEFNEEQSSFENARFYQNDKQTSRSSWNQEKNDPNYHHQSHTGSGGHKSTLFGESDAVLAKLQTIRRGPDGRFVNLVEVISDVDILLDAYQKVKAGPNGNPDEVRVDNICLDWFFEAQAKLRNGTFKFKPVKQVLIRKKAPRRGKRRRAPDLEPRKFAK